MSQSQRKPPRQRGSPSPSFLNAFRIADWWDFKLTPPLAFFCGTLVMAGEPLMPHWADTASLVAAVAVCAAYVSLINEYFDREDDARSGKPNRLTGLPLPMSRLLMLALPVSGAAIAFSWGAAALPILAYAGSWLAFTAYSAPPSRLKTRGLPGVIADAAGSTLFPILLAVMLASRVSGGHDPFWTTAAIAWAAGWGLRCILWHQVMDAEHDRAGSVRTLVQRIGSEKATRIVRFVALPLELAGLLLSLTLLESLVLPLLLALYLAVIAGRALLWRARNSGLFLSEFYDGLLPLGMIVASALRYPSDWLLLIPYFVLFWRRPITIFYHALRLCWDFARRLWYRAVSALLSLARGRFRFD